MTAAKKRRSAPRSDDASGSDGVRRAAMRRALRELTQRFVSDVMSLFQDALVLEARSAASAPLREPGRRPRRDVGRLDAVAEDVVRLLASGITMSVSQLATAVGSTPRELAHPIARLVRAGQVVQHGERKGTRYALPPPKRGAAAKRKGAARVPKRAATPKPTRARKR